MSTVEAALIVGTAVYQPESAVVTIQRSELPEIGLVYLTAEPASAQTLVEAVGASVGVPVAFHRML